MRSVSSHLASSYTYAVTTGPKISSHMSRYAGSFVSTSVGSTNHPTLPFVPPPATTVAFCFASAR